MMRAFGDIEASNLAEARMNAHDAAHQSRV